MEIQLALISTLGQQLTTLSGGERQRLKVAIQMATDDGEPRIVLEPVRAPEEECALLCQVANLFEAMEVRGAHPRPRLVGPDGQQIELPESVIRVLRQAVQVLAEGDGVTIVPYHHLLTTQKAADLLNVSRPYLIRLLEEGKIPYTRVGTHRRIRFSDLLAYKEARDRERRQGLRKLTRMSQELGLYTARQSDA